MKSVVIYLLLMMISAVLGREPRTNYPQGFGKELPIHGLGPETRNDADTRLGGAHVSTRDRRPSQR